MDELIRKQDAIEAINIWLYCDKDERMPADVIKALPPVQTDVPDTNVGDMISRHAAMDTIAKMMPRSYTPDGSHPADEEIFRAQEIFADCIEAIEIMPSVRPKLGKWIERESDTEDKENGFETVIVCSRCDYPATTFYSEDCESRTQIRTAFCPTCGADMRGEAE